MDMPGKKPTAQTCSRISYSCKRCKLLICTDLEDYKIHTTEALIVDTYLELVCMHKAIQWQSNKHKLHCVDGLAALLIQQHITYPVSSGTLHSWVQTPARWLLQWAHLMTSVSSWDRTRRCPLDATAYTTAPAHLARNAALLHFLSYREPFHLIPASGNSSLLPHQNWTMSLR
jgi:hypothetical protein